MSDGEDGAMTTEDVATHVRATPAQRSEAGRVVLRGVQVIVLDDLQAEVRTAVLAAAAGHGTVRQPGGEPATAPREAWIPLAAKGGTYDEAILNAAGDTPGKYRAVKVKAWREQTPRHIEPPLS